MQFKGAVVDKFFRNDFARIAEFVHTPEPARLLPVLSDVQGEKRLTSIFLAVLMAVEEYGKDLLSEIGAPIGKNARVRCVAEPRFKDQPDNGALQPDGLIVVNNGSREWWALVEAKVRRASLDASQLEQYHQIAWANEVDAIITISNDHAEEATHVPVPVQIRRRVAQYHWSWQQLLSRALIMADKGEVADDDQAYVLREFIRHLGHPKSGMVEFDSMGEGWKPVCDAVQNSRKLSKGGADERAAVRAWHQLLGHVALKLSVQIGCFVDVKLNAKHKANPEERVQADLAALVETGSLAAELTIPNAASLLGVTADFAKRTLTARMEVKPPRDKTRASASGTWIRNQLKACEDETVLIDATYRGRMRNVTASLGELRLDNTKLVSSDPTVLPSSLEVRRVVAEKDFAGPMKFVTALSNLVLDYYEDVGQHLMSWVPKAPPVPRDEAEEVEAETAPA